MEQQAQLDVCDVWNMGIVSAFNGRHVPEELENSEHLLCFRKAQAWGSGYRFALEILRKKQSISKEEFIAQLDECIASIPNEHRYGPDHYIYLGGAMECKRVVTLRGLANAGAIPQVEFPS